MCFKDFPFIFDISYKQFNNLYQNKSLNLKNNLSCSKYVYISSSVNMNL